MPRPSYKRPFVRKSASGTARVQREGYSTSRANWWDIRKEVFKRDGGKCGLYIGIKKCNNPAVDVHHIVPLSRGGVTAMGNLISVCESCHKARHSHMRR